MLCVFVFTLALRGKMLFGRIAGSIELAGSPDLPFFDILNLFLLPGRFARVSLARLFVFSGSRPYFGLCLGPP